MSLQIDLSENSNLSTNAADDFAVSEVSLSQVNDSPIEQTISFNETGVIVSENFELVPGRRIGSKLLYLKREKCLYTPVNKDKYGQRYKCFEKQCNVRVLKTVDGVCEKSKKSTQHIDHSSHEDLRRKFLAEHKMKEDCANVDVLCGGSAQTVSVRSVFDNNIAQ